MNEKKDNATIQQAGPFGPYTTILKPYESEYHHAFLSKLATDLEWLLKSILWQGQQTDLPTEQSDEIKTALNNYRELCLLIGKDPTLL